MRISLKAQRDIADRFEAALDYVEGLDRVPFHIKRDAADKAAAVALAHIKKETNA